MSTKRASSPSKESDKIFFQEEVNRRAQQIVRRSRSWRNFGKLVVLGGGAYIVDKAVIASHSSNGPPANNLRGWGIIGAICWVALWFVLWIIAYNMKRWLASPQHQHRKAVRQAAREQLAQQTDDPVQKAFIRHPVATRAVLYGTAFYLGGRRKK